MNQRDAALDFIAGSLGIDHRPEVTDKLRSDITSGRLAWEVVVGMANNHLVTPALWVALNDKGLVEYLPEDLREYLRELHRLNKQRNEHLKGQAIEAVQQLNSAGIEPVLLKGGVHLFTNTFTDFAARIMTDLDILVPKQKLDICLKALYVLGYHTDKRQEISYRRHHHHAPLIRSGAYGTIELHRAPVFCTAAQILPTEAAWTHIEPLIIEGLKINALSPTYKVLHNILHSEIVDRCYKLGQINLRSLYDLVSISNFHGERIDWLVIQELMDYYGKGDMLRAYLYLAHRLFGMAMPDTIQPTQKSVAHFIRCRKQAQWTRLRWVWVRKWDEIMREFSASYIRCRYDCKNNLLSLMIGRVRYIGYLLSKHSGRMRYSIAEKW